MKILVAIDSFKTSITSFEAGEACKKGILKADKTNKVYISPLADGGEGTLEVLTTANKGVYISKEVTGPMGSKVIAKYGLCEKKNLAIIEMSQACGIGLVDPNKKNPLLATTYGVGELIKDAINRGVINFIIGIGGSATMDGGIGMLMALGYEFKDRNGELITPNPEGLKHLASIEIKNHLKELDKCHFLVACDVNNPLCGRNGSAYIFGPQKGATPETIKNIDNWLSNYGKLSDLILKKKAMNIKGSGAAGGIGYALCAYLNAKMESGISIVLKETKLENIIKKVDIVVTGEGRLDGQTIMGKAPIGVAKLAKKYHKPVIGIAAVLKEDVNIINKHGIDAYFSILHRIVVLEESLKKETAYRNMMDEAEQIFRLIKTVKESL